jgi:hypothetical protein
MRGEIRAGEAASDRTEGFSMAFSAAQPMLECPRCGYVGEAAESGFEIVDLLTLAPPFGHLFHYVLRGNRKVREIRCAMCDYAKPVAVSEEAARSRLGNSRYEQLMQQRRLRAANETRVAVTVVAVLAFAAYVIYLIWLRF